MVDTSVTERGIEVAGELLLTWDEVDSRRGQIRFANSVLVKVGFTYGRVSDLYDEVIYDRDVWARIKAGLEGTSAYFSDFAGKHSEVSLDLWDSVDLEEVTDLQAIVAFHKAHGNGNSNLDIIGDAILQAQENGEMDEEYNKISE